MRLKDADAIVKRLKELYCKNCNDYDGVKCRACAMDDALSGIDDAPTIDAVPVVHGQWTEEEVWASELAQIDEWQSAKCSVCGKYHTTPYMYYFDDYNFCPHCGADMRANE